MKTLKSKTIAITIALVLMLTSTMSIASLQPAKASYIYQTFTYLACSPNPIGVNQTLLINFWITPPMPQPGILAHNYTIQITHPDGTVETLGPFNSIQADTTMWTTWTPDTVGTYTLQCIYPGETVPIGTPYQSITIGSPYSSYTTTPYVYLPSKSLITTLTVQTTPIPGYQPTAMPTQYWSMPISIENREWYTLLGDWYQSGNGGGCYSQPYGGAPLSPHIYWTIPPYAGGLVGNSFNFSTYDGQSPPTGNVVNFMTMAIDGYGYYSTPEGMHCVDLQTGNELWVSSNVTASVCGQEEQILRAQGPPIDAFQPILMSIGSTFYKWRAATGQFVCGVVGMSGTFVPSEQAVYSVQTNLTSGNRLIKWSIVGDSNNFTSRIIYNVTYPLGGITAINGGVGIYFTTPAINETAVVGSYSGGFDCATGRILWTYNFTSDFAPFPSTGCLSDNVYCYPLYAGDPNQNGLRPLCGISALTGAVLFNTTITSYPWGSFWSYSQTAFDGLICYPTYTGYVWAFNATTGVPVWKGGYNYVGYETPYGYQPFFSALMSAGGNVYAGNDEHSEGPPYYQGKQLWCLNGTTGATIWSIPFWVPGFNFQGLIADGMLIATNYYDGQQYCFNKGTSATTITASPKVSVQGSSVLIEGTVTDTSPGTQGTREVALYPYGVPCVSEDSMSQFMAYLYMQKPEPTNTTGVPVSIDVIDSNGNYRTIGTTTSDASGAFSFQWTPDIPGKYTVIATFAGSTSYWPSSAESAFAVSEAPSVAPTATPQSNLATTADLMTYMVAVAIAIIIAIAIVGFLILRKHA
jgi:hypothetical protein